MKLSLTSILESITDDNKKGRMVAIMLPREVSTQLQHHGRHTSGDSVDPDDMHITLGLVHQGKNKDILKTLKHIAKQTKPFPVKIDQMGMFPPHEGNENMHILHAKPHSSYFGPIHKAIMRMMHKKNIDIDNGSHDFSPHITIKYSKKEPQLFPLDLDFIVDHLALVDHGKIYKVRFEK